jgi:MFS superfamily sulfate permease-like transporter
MTLSTLLKKPSAFLPILMSLAALATLVIFLLMFGVVHEPDENAAAHIWQLLMGLQLLVIAFFAIKWLPRLPRQALIILALQAAAALAAMAPVYLLKL